MAILGPHGAFHKTKILGEGGCALIFTKFGILTIY
jgi:hypothetical protein